jgi:hypothetical protein
MVAKHLSFGALNKTTKEYTYPNIASKAEKYICPQCERDLTFKKGKIKRPHFAHKRSDDPCNYYNNPGESEIHKDAKCKAKLCLQYKVPFTFTRQCQGKFCKNDLKEIKITEDQYSKAVEAREEVAFNYNNSKKMADVALVDYNSNPIFIIEIVHTHSTKEEDRPNNIPWVELNASKFIELFDNEVINLNNPLVPVSVPCLRNEHTCDFCIQEEKQREIKIQMRERIQKQRDQENKREKERLKQIPKQREDKQEEFDPFSTHCRCRNPTLQIIPYSGPRMITSGLISVCKNCSKVPQC